MRAYSTTAAACSALLALLLMPTLGCSEGSDARRDAVEEERVFSGDDLFIYINGGAAIYNEYGFEKVRVREYARGGRIINVEIFEMQDAEAAYGIYTFKRGAGGENVAVGQEGCLEDYFLNFWKGDFQVTLTALDADVAIGENLKALAREVEAGIDSAGERPLLVRALPAEGLKEDSVQFIAGRVGLFNASPALARMDLPFEKVAKGDYDGGLQVFLFSFPDDTKCRQALPAVRGHIDKSDLSMRVDLHGDCIIVVQGEGDREALESLSTRVKASLDAAMQR